MTNPNYDPPFDNTSVPQGTPAPTPLVTSTPVRRKKPHIAVRVLMQLLSFCLFIVLFASLLATTVVADFHAITLEDLDLSGILSSNDPSEEDLSSKFLGELIDAVTEQIEAETGENLPFTAEQIAAVVLDSTVTDYLSEKAASYADDILNGTENTVITTEEIVGLLEENQALIETELGIQITPEFKEAFTQRVDEVVVQGDLNTVIRDTLNDAVDTAIQEATGGMDTVAVRELIAFFASDTLLYACLGICVVLLLLLCLLNWYNVPAGLTWAGMAALIAGSLLSLPVGLIQSTPELIEVITVGITPIANLIHSFIGLLASVHYTVLLIGVGLIVLSIVWRILRASAWNKQAASAA